jgi:hypothetical protein
MNNLILRTTNSPYGDVNKGSVLSQGELDENFVSLKGEVIYTGETQNDQVILKKYNGHNISFPVSNVTHWLEGTSKTVGSTETVVISGDYVLRNSQLYLLSDNDSITIGNLIFNKYAQIFIGGYLLLVDSNIVNDGLINVAGGVILSGNSTITGTGILI